MSLKGVDDVHYHTGIFSWKKSIGMATIGGLAITAFAFGVLSFLHINLPFIPTGHGAGTIFTVAGGAFALIDVVLMTICTVKHYRVRDKMNDDLKLNINNIEFQDEYKELTTPKYYIVSWFERDRKVVHIFTTQTEFDHCTDKLEDRGIRELPDD